MSNEQLSLFGNSQQPTVPQDSFDELPDEELGVELQDDPQVSLNRPELLTIRLFRQAICEAEGNEGDCLLRDFTEYVLPNLMGRLVGTTAKGGQFFERLDARGTVKRRDNAGDQSLPAHLLNGFLPTYRIARRLQQPDMGKNQVKSYCEDLQFRVYAASYLLHDYEKFPDYLSWLLEQDVEGKWRDRDWVARSPDKQDAPNLGRDYVIQKIVELGLDRFLGDSWRDFIDDIIWISNNAGDKYDADLGMGVRGLQLLDDHRLDGRVRNVLVNLVKLSDRFASIIKHPQDIEKDSLTTLLFNLSNGGQLKFTYHALSDNRGVLTNIINNAHLDANPDEFYRPLLYLPDGVVYLAKADAPAIAADRIADAVIQKIKTLCGERLRQRQIGFARDGKGIKFADYYWLYFDIDQLMNVANRAACRIIPSTKTSSAAKRSASLASFQAAGNLPEHLEIEFGEDYRIDRLAEFGDTLCRRIWGDWRDRFNTWQKQKSKAKRTTLPELDLTQKLAEYMGLVSEIPAIRAIQSLKKTGGVPLDWYYLAAKYIKANAHLDDGQLQKMMAELVERAATLVEPIVREFILPDGWDDLRTYIQRVVSLPSGGIVPPQTDPFLTELSRYKAAKIVGRGRENVCAMSSSAYTVTEQMESSTLFAPQVYSNRQILFNAQAAKRQICAIWSVEVMLRQILMNQTNATGGDFEGRKYRYLYLYPAYFFTPETNRFIQKAYSWIRRTRFDADIRKHLVNDKQVVQLDIENYQQVDSLLLQEETERDATFKLSYLNEPMTFFFMALPPGRDATDTESWVMPAWLAFALPLVLDVKVVASESPVPPYVSGANFERTTVLDGAHQAIASLVKQDQYRLDAILPAKFHTFSPLNALSAAYCIHLEVNRKKDGNPDWGKLSALSRDLETSPLYVFHYLTKLVRKLDWDTAPVAKIALYVDFYNCFEPEGTAMNQLRELTRLYRRFYRAKSQYAKPNAILKPIDEASDVILKIDKALVTDEQALIDVVAARIAKLMTNVRRKTAEGKPTLVCIDGKWKRALTSEEERQAVYEFATFFVKDLFQDTFKGDRARLAGIQLNLIRDTCDYLYRLIDDEERRAVQQSEPEDLPEEETEDAA
ncbi:MAG: type I-D CRISPR-associated protein Cas10d/Csc3 [Cyanobacteriota bacterium]|nr:type I-D CRISPR-associated protein Cas10d/Csc3 [Cyanobacteriota bacterium]